jgi:hypothetical protein
MSMRKSRPICGFRRAVWTLAYEVCRSCHLDRSYIAAQQRCNDFAMFNAASGQACQCPRRYVRSVICQILQQAIARPAVEALVQQHADPHRLAEFPRSIIQAGGGAVTIPGTQPHWQLGR